MSCVYFICFEVYCEVMGDCDELVCFFVYLNCVEWFVLDGLECDVTNNVELYVCLCLFQLVIEM